MSFRLQGKRALVTGAASGIGKAIAQEFASAGAEVILLDLDREKVEAAVKEMPGEATGLACDVSDEAAVEAAFEELRGGLDVLVNSAGIAHVGTVLNTNAADFDRLYRVNVRGTFLCMQAAARIMQGGDGGVILNLASVAATAGLSDRLAYSMTKGAVLAMTLSAAKDLLPFGIRVNCISPGRVHTPFVDGFVAGNYPGRETEMMNTLARAQPIGRMGMPEEIAKMALYLCCEAASFITGSDMPIDGGFATLR
jgi:2-keto-3-deoxy-L-fuconate dehydrogenase